MSSHQWIDTHAHLADDKFQDDLPEIIERASQAGLTQIIGIATTARDSAQYVSLAEKYPSVYATVGLQPNNLAKEPDNAWEEILSLVDKPKVVALGETGLDRYWDFTPFALQEEYFARHLRLARQHDLPVVIHCREAETDTVQMLKADYETNGTVKGVMHSFVGDLETAHACLAMGLHISFAGMVTFKNAQALRDIAREIPMDRLLVETDCPYLAPVPKRGKRNEPSYVIHTGGCLADVKGLSLAEIAQATSANARTLFRLP